MLQLQNLGTEECGDLPKVTQLTSVRGQRVGPSPGSLAAEHRSLTLLIKKGLCDNTLGAAVLASSMLRVGKTWRL